jgi:divalent metal cation (Fe/Co/Zn/Cd) transporter
VNDRAVRVGALPSNLALEQSRLHRRAYRLEGLTLLWNVIEAVVAIGSGAVAGSTALLAFGVDSLIEVASALAVVWRLRRAGPGASAEESEAADRRAHFLVGLTFFLLAGYVLVDCLIALAKRSSPESSTVGLVLAFASLVVMPLLAYAKQRTGRAMGSLALQADARETWLCAYLSASLLLGLWFNARLGIWWADSVAALAMVPFIVWQGIGAVREARSTDESPAAA